MSSRSTHIKNDNCKMLRFKLEHLRRKCLVKLGIFGTEVAGCDVGDGTKAGAPVPAAAYSSLQVRMVVLPFALLFLQ